MGLFKQTRKRGPARVAPTVADLAPIAGVGIELFVEISKSLAEVSYDQSRSHELAARRGVGAAEWDAAVSGWNERMRCDPTVAKRFNHLYMGR